MAYRDRRTLLSELDLNGPSWQVPAHREGDGAALLEATAAQGLEGIVAKRLDSPYEPGRRSSAWIKVKNRPSQEVVIGGWLPGEGRRRTGSAPSPSGSTTETGSCTREGGAGFTEETLATTMRALEPLRRPNSPFDGRQPPKGTIFVEPRLVAQVEFAEWTATGTLRAPSFKGLRPPSIPGRSCARADASFVARSAPARPDGYLECMARAIWSGAISFGLVNIPVKLYSAVSKKTVRFHQLDSESGTRIAQKRVNPQTGEEVPYEKLVKGYELSPDRYVVIRPEELEAIEPKKTRTIEIEDFVEIDQIDPIYYDHPYYLAPGHGRRKALRAPARGAQGVRPRGDRARRDPLEGAAGGDPPARGRADDGDAAVRRRGRVARPTSTSSTAADEAKATKKEVEMARQLIDSLATDFDPSKYKDEYREAVLEMIERKAEGQEIAVQEAPEEPAEVPDLMAALEASIAAAKRQGGSGGEEDATDGKPKAAAKAGASSKSGGGSKQKRSKPKAHRATAQSRARRASARARRSSAVAATAVEVEVEGRRLRLSNLDKVLYPEVGFTKGQVIDYYTRAAPWLLPHLRGRALTLKRYPNGVDAEPLLREAEALARARVGAARARSRRGDADDRLRALRRPADADLAGQPRRPRAAPLAGAGGRSRPTDSDRFRPRPGTARGAGGVLRGGAAAARDARAARPGVLRQDLRVEGHAGLRAPEHRRSSTTTRSHSRTGWRGCSRLGIQT